MYLAWGNEKFTERFGRGTSKKQTNQRKQANINFHELRLYSVVQGTMQ
jgi:hypothetical protein